MTRPRILDNESRRLAELRRKKALLKAVALQDSISNSANFSSIATDAKGVIQIFNVGAERMLGYTAAEVVNTITPADISDPQEVIARAEALSAELATTITPGFEALIFKASRGIEDIYALTYIRKDGSRFPAIVSVTALRDAQSAIIGYLLIGTDNTARKQAEAEQKKLDQRLRDQQFYTRSLIESNIDALMTTDPAGIITDVNKQMEALTGCTRDELIGAPFRNYFTDPDRAEAGIKLVLREKRVTDYELTARAMDGKTTVVSYNATTFYDQGRTLQGVFAAARDVTKHKTNERALAVAKLEAERANRAKSDFLSRMSHDLRTPLNAILGFAQLLEMDNLNMEQREGVRLILKGGAHLLGVINEILDIARIESGHMSLSPEPVSISDIVAHVFELVRPLAVQRCIAFDDDTVTVCGSRHVMADRQRLTQILLNLLSNAVKYNRDAGRVRLSCEDVPDGRLRIKVSDTGAGISPEKLELLFQPFERLGAEHSGIEGTGLGLVMSKGLAEAMGGALGVESEVDRGSTFWVELALADPAAETAASSVLAPSDASGQDSGVTGTVLYIEDNISNRRLMERLAARRPGVRLVGVTHGQAGLDVARTSQLDLILLDLHLPDMPGEEVLRRLREDPGTRAIPVAVLSADATPAQVRRLRAAGAMAYLTKPLDVREVLQLLDDTLTKRSV